MEEIEYEVDSNEDSNEIHDNEKKVTDEDNTESDVSKDEVIEEPIINTNKVMMSNLSIQPVFGIALKGKTHVYGDQSRNSKSLKTYDQGSILKYTDYNNSWYAANVYIKGVKQEGFIHKDDVETSIHPDKQEILFGIALKGKTHVFTSASTSSKSIRSYPDGSILKYKTYSKDWYEAKVYIKGEPVIGYIHKNDVEDAVKNQKTLYGLVTNSSTNVYTSPSQNSKSIRFYNYASLLKFKSFSENWYEAKVYINGEPVIGYIHKNDVSKEDAALYGYVKITSLNVYKSKNKNSNTLKKYAKGSKLKFKYHDGTWYEAKVKVNNKYEYGFIHKSDISFSEVKPEPKPEPEKPTGVNKTEYTDYGISLDKATDIQINRPTVITDKYKNAPAYISVDDVEISNKATINGNNVNIRTEPNTTSSSPFQLNNGATITIVKEVKGSSVSGSTVWYEIKRDDETYYVHSSLVSANSGIVKANKATINGNNVNIRTQPNTTSSSPFQLNNGAAITIVKEVKGASVSGSTVWYEIKRDNKTYYVHSSLVSLGQADVRAGKGTNYHVFGTLQNGQSVNIISSDAKWHQISYNEPWRRPSRADMKEYLDPSKNDKMQHLRLDSSVGVSASQLNKLLAGKGTLTDQGQAFINGGKKHGINEIYLMMHAFLESGNGTSTLANGVDVGLNSNGNPVRVTSSNRKNLTNIKTTYNMFGIGAVDSDPLNGGAQTAYEYGWFTPAAAIEGGAKWIGEQYIYNSYKQNTLYKMKWNPQMNNGNAWKQYATDIGWATKQAALIKNHYKQLNNPSYHYDIAKYK